MPPSGATLPIVIDAGSAKLVPVRVLFLQDVHAMIPFPCALRT
jgi:hypothetical protein